jgi:molybdopterin/thiamine biosynthesis adenylyltransferase
VGRGLFGKNAARFDWLSPDEAERHRSSSREQHRKMSFSKYLKDCKASISETDVATVCKVVDLAKGKSGDGNGAGPILIDVREKDEWTEGFIPGARWISRGFLEQRIEDQVPERSAEIVLYCAGGTRSEMGEAGQVKLLKSKVLCLGAGGLGSPAGLYLAAAGVGTVGFVDDDTVDASNLQRQILHATDRVGLPKVESAKLAIAKLNPDVKVIGHQTRLDSSNVMDILKDYDLIVDGADNFPTRYLLNDAALKLGKPIVHGSIYRFEGQVTSFVPGKGCYRCSFPEPPPPDMAPSCQEAGVLGVLCGVIGSLQTVEAIKILLGIGKPLSDRTLFFDALNLKFREFKRHKVPTCPTCGEGIKPENIELIDYQAFCNVGA